MFFSLFSLLGNKDEISSPFEISLPFIETWGVGQNCYPPVLMSTQRFHCVPKINPSVPFTWAVNVFSLEFNDHIYSLAWINSHCEADSDRTKCLTAAFKREYHLRLSVVMVELDAVEERKELTLELGRHHLPGNQKG